MNYKLCRCVIFFKWFDCIKKSLYELLRRLMKLLHCCSGFLWMMFQMEKFTSSSSGFHSRPTPPCWWRWPHWCFIRYWYILHLISTGAHSRLLATRLPILKVQCEGFKGRIFILTFKLVYDYLKPWSYIIEVGPLPLRVNCVFFFAISPFQSEGGFACAMLAVYLDNASNLPVSVI